jgi:hypothetical protein
MGNIRINVLARELEVKSHLILDYLTVLGVEKKSHSSALDDEIADKVREHFRVLVEGGEVAEEAPAPPPPTPVVSIEPPAAVVEPRKLPDIIKADAFPGRDKERGAAGGDYAVTSKRGSRPRSSGAAGSSSAEASAARGKARAFSLCASPSYWPGCRSTSSHRGPTGARPGPGAFCTGGG